MAETDPIYMDYAATTPVDPRVAARMAEFLTCDGCFANPASAHAAGRRARVAVEHARQQVAGLIGATPQEIVFTSGATESDNLAILGGARFRVNELGRARHIVTSRTEHKAVLDTCAALEHEGFEITRITPGPDGRITPDQVSAALREDTALVSIMLVNNEIGVVQDVIGIGSRVRAVGALFHVDAAQAAGKIPIEVGDWPVDLMSISAHKMYGPKGIGALYVCHEPRALLEPQMHGGGHEGGLRSGTLATHQIVGLGEAAAIAVEHLDVEIGRISALRRRFLDRMSVLEGVTYNGCSVHCCPGIVNLAFDGLEGEALLFALHDLSVSGGSACTSTSAEPSFVLRAIGRDDQLAGSSLRFSFGRFTTEEEVDRAVARVIEEVTRLRAVAGDLVEASRA
jgi:cysteine desulfurase